MPYPEWGEYDFISQSVILDPENEQRCPNPKVRLVDAKPFDAAIESTWNQYGLNEWRGTDDRTRGNAFNTQRLLCHTLPSAHLCSYHLGRGMAAVVLEVIGFPCNQYGPLVAPMTTLINVVTSDASPLFIETAQDTFREFMAANESGGTQDFAYLMRRTEPVARKKTRWWQTL